MALDTLPIPPFARSAPLRGAYEARVDRVLGAVRQSLREPYGAADADVLHLDDGAPWEAVEAFYTDAFATGDLADAGFVRQDQTSGDPDRYRLAVWAREPAGRPEAVGVAVVLGRPDGPASFLLLLHAPRE